MIATFFTALVFGYTVQGKPFEAAIWFNSYQECIDAMPYMDNIYNHVSDTMSGSHVYMWCSETNIRSNKIIRPKLRPEGTL